MPTIEPPTQLNEPNEPSGAGPDASNPVASSPDVSSPAPPPDPEPSAQGHSTSRWIDYDTHELLDMISELEDERRWARLREGILWALLAHILLISLLTWIPKYVLKVPPVIDPFEAINKRKDLSYLDLPPDALKALQPKVVIKPVPERQSHVDKKTLDALNKPAPPPPPEPKPEVQNPVQPQAATPVPPSPTSQSQVEAPRPPAVPARPNFAMGSQNPADQLRQALQGAANSQGSSANAPSGGNGLSRHPGAGAGGLQILSDTQGVDFNSWIHRWYYETEHTWDPLIPDEVNPPILKTGAVQIRFKVLPNGRIMEGSMVLEGRSGDTGLDRAAWGALTGSNYPPLPREFHGPYLELRALFLYNEQPPR
jgi:outer membrane biosynthesis protein TonB